MSHLIPTWYGYSFLLEKQKSFMALENKNLGMKMKKMMLMMLMMTRSNWEFPQLYSFATVNSPRLSESGKRTVHKLRNTTHTRSRQSRKFTASRCDGATFLNTINTARGNFIYSQE